MMNGEPSPNGENGQRDDNGRFAKGNRGGPGNPYGKRVGELRSLMLDAVSDADLRAIVAALVQQAKSGDLAAIREVLNRVVGRPAETPDPRRLELDEKRFEIQRQRLELAEDRLFS